MSVTIHQTALVSKNASLGENVSVGPYSIIEDDVTIDDEVSIASHVLIASGSRLSKNVSVHHGAVVGTIPQDLKFSGEKTLLKVGENTTIREYATLNRGTSHNGETTIGKGCLLMAYTHVAHDCILGDHVIMSNAVNLAGHVEIGDFAVIGGMVPIHQFVKIGAHSMIGGGFRVPMDIVPYAMCGGYPLKVMGLNLVGLKRRDFSKECIDRLERAFRILFRSKLNTSQAIEKIRVEVEPCSEISSLLDFVAQSERGICK